jgi:biotin carboxyl carrier protein
MKLWVTLDGRDEEVEFRTEGEHLWLEVAGRTLAADFHRLPDGEVYSLLVDGRSYEVRVVHGENAVEVTHHGVTLPVEVRHPLEKFVQSSLRAAGPGGGETIVAPMPGVVIAVRVSVGERVEAGQAVAVVEAMKMQNELLAVRGGVVSEIRVAERATVGAGQVLLKLAPVGSS